MPFVWFEAQDLREFERLVKVFEGAREEEFVQPMLTWGPPHGTLISRGDCSMEFIAFLKSEGLHVRVGSPVG
jgi:hypothetical protein